MQAAVAAGATAGGQQVKLEEACRRKGTCVQWYGEAAAKSTTASGKWLVAAVVVPHICACELTLCAPGIDLMQRQHH